MYILKSAENKTVTWTKTIVLLNPFKYYSHVYKAVKITESKIVKIGLILNTTDRCDSYRNCGDHYQDNGGNHHETS